MRNKTSLWIIVAVMAVAGLIFASTARAQTDAPVTDPSPRTLSINGSGIVAVEPDMAYIQVGVHTEGTSAQEVVASNNQQSQAVIDAISEAGVAESDIQTSNFSIYPRQEWDASGQPTGQITYVVDNTVSVTVRDLASIGTLLDAAVQAGANSIYGIQFDVQDREAAQQQAMTAAMENAQARAEVLAESAGVALGQILSIQTYLGSTNPIPYGGAYMAAAEAVAASVPVSAGEMQIVVDLNVVYEIQ